MDPKTLIRPWGKEFEYTLNTPSTVKILVVNPNEELSLQFHHKRSEFWRILSGNPTIVIGDKTIESHPGDEFFIPAETLHRIKAVDHAEVLEISLGEFQESDIVRKEDKYGRS